MNHSTSTPASCDLSGRGLSSLPSLQAIALTPIVRMLAKPRQAAIANWFVYTALTAYAAFAVLSFFGNQVNRIDEALQLLGGREVLEGRMPHRDFWSMYPPLNYYLNGLAFRIGGQSFMVARFVSAIFYGIAVWVLSAYVNNRLKSEAAWLRWTSLALVVFMVTRVLTLSQNNALLAAVVLFVYHATKVERDGHLSYPALVVCGVASGLMLPMRLNYGLYSVVSIGAGLTFADAAFARSTLEQRSFRLAAFVVPVLVTVLLFFLPFGSAAKEVVSQVARTPGLVLRAGNIYDVSDVLMPYCAILAVVGFGLTCAHLDLQNQRERNIALSFAGATALLAMLALRLLSASHLLLVPYVVPAIVASAVVASQLAWKRFPQPVLVSLCFLACSLQHYLIRADGLHLYILAAAVSVVAATGIVDQPHPARVGAMALLFWLMILPNPTSRDAVVQWILPLNPKSIRPALEVLSRRDSFLALGDSARLMNGAPLSDNERRFFPETDELSVLRYIDRMASPSDTVFSGLRSHDRTTINDARLAWVMPRRLASRYLELEPGVITSEPVQREVVQSLSAGVRWVVLEDSPLTGIARYPVPRSRVLDEYIAANYRCAASFGPFRACCRPEACPAP
jgi:hypothetical protein